MAIDDNTVYGLTGAQLKELPGKIEAVKGLARELTTADYNYPADNPTSVALWLLPAGIYAKTDSSVWVRVNTSSNLGIGTFIQMHHSGQDQTTTLAVQEGTSKTLVAYYTKTSDGTNLTGGGGVLLSSNVVDALTSASPTTPLSANQGKVLKDMIDALPTGGVTELTTADYNYPTNNPTSLALWLLDEGTYVVNDKGSAVSTKMSTTATSTVYYGVFVIVGPTDGRKQIIGFYSDNGTDKARFEHVAADGTYLSGLNLYGPTVVQSTGTNVGNVMSQSAVTSMVYVDPATKRKIHLGDNSSANGADGIAIGYGANANSSSSSSVAIGSLAGVEEAPGGVALGTNSKVTASGGIALGAGSKATATGQVDIGTNNYLSYGYNNSNYRLLTGLYDPQSAHDAATKGYVDTAVTAVDTPDEFTSSEWNTLWA